MKKILILFTIVISISVVTVISIFAISYDYNNQNNSVLDLSKIENDSEKIQVSDCEFKNKTFIYEGREIQLKYDKTEKSSIGIIKHYYNDQFENMYVFDECDKFIEFTSNLKHCENSYSFELSKDDAVAKSKDVFNKSFGERFKNMELYSVTENDMNVFYIKFVKMYNNKISAYGEYANMMMKSDGTIISYGLENEESMKKFNEKCLEKIDKNIINSAVDRCLKEIYKDKLKSFEVEEIYIIKLNDEFKLNISVKIKTIDNNNSFNELIELSGNL